MIQFKFFVLKKLNFLLYLCTKDKCTNFRSLIRTLESLVFFVTHNHCNNSQFIVQDCNTIYNLTQQIKIYIIQMDKQINLELFKQYDKDNDGKISLEEVGDLLKQLGMNIYPASLEKDLNSIIYSNSEEYELEQFVAGINFQTLQNYVESRSSTIKKYLWRQKCDIKSAQNQLKQTLQGRDLKTIRDREMVGLLEIHIDKQEGQYEVQIHAGIRKQKKSTPHPTLELILIGKQKEDCTKIQENVKNLFQMIKQISTGEDPTLQADLNLISCKSSIELQKKQVSFYFQGKIPQIIDFQPFYTDFLDRILQNKIQGKIEGTYKTNNTLLQYLKQQKSLSLYDFLTKRSSVCLEWESGQFITALKEFVLVSQGLSDFQYDRTEIVSLLILGLLNSENIRGSFEFESKKQSEVEEQDNPFIEEMKGFRLQILSSLQEGVQMLVSEFAQFGVADLLKMIDDKIVFKGTFGTLTYDLSLKIRNLNKILNFLLEPREQENDNDDDSDD